MENVSGWGTLLGDPFFQHMEGSLAPDDVQRLLTIIGDEFYRQEIKFNADESRWIIPEGNIHKEAIGFKAEMAKRGLKELLEATKGTASGTGEGTGWKHRFLTEQKFQAYVFQLLDFLTACVQISLPDRKQIPSFKDRVEAAAQDNVEELKDVKLEKQRQLVYRQKKPEKRLKQLRQR